MKVPSQETGLKSSYGVMRPYPAFQYPKNQAAMSARSMGAVKDFNKRGIDSLLRRKAKGAEPKFTEENCKKILEQFSKVPQGHSCLLLTWVNNTPVHIVCAAHEDVLIISQYICPMRRNG